MSELRNQIELPEKGDLSSQLSAMIGSGAIKVRHEVPQETPISVAANDELKVRGGRGSKMVPGSLTTTFEEINKEEERIKHEEEDELKQVNEGVKELNAAHLIFASNIATLKNKLSKNPTPAEEKRLNIMLSMARDNMGAIEKILPINTQRKGYDSYALKIGIIRFKEYEDARRKQMLAETNHLQGRGSEEEVRNTQRKANYLSGEIFELTKNEREKSLQERKELNAETTNSTTMPENPQTLPQPQETPTAPESAPAEPAITIEPAQGAENSLQDEALAILENEGGTTPKVNPELEVAKEIALENITEGAASEKVPAAIETKVETAEEKKERILSSIYKFHNVELPERAKKAGMSESLLDVLRTGGAVYNELPLKKKLLISVALFGTAWVAGGTIASIAMGGSLAQRALGGMATFVAAEGALKASAEKDGRERGVWEKRRHTAEALVAGFLVGGGYAGQAFQNIFSPLAETAEEVSKFYSDAPLTHVEAPVAAAVSPENISATGSFIEIAQSGDSVWKMTEHQLETQMGEKFTSLSPEQQTYIIDAIKDRIEQNPDAFGVADINNIEVGKGIDFTNALNDKEFIANAFTHAQGLSPEEITNIKNYEDSIIPEAEARVLTPEELIALANGEVKSFDVIPSAEAMIMGEGEISTAETAPVGILESSPSSEVIAHPDAHIKVGNIEGTFKYSPDGKTVVGFVSTGTLEAPDTLEAKKILNDGWRGIVLSNETGLSSLNTSIVENRASTIYQYEQILKALDGQGGGMTPEADYLREQIANIVTDTEKTYGDVFKDISGTQEVVSAIPMEETNIMPQDITPGNPEVVTSASKYVHTYINDMFGSKGIFGFGAVDGMKTPNWLDFANRPVAEIMQAQPNPTPSSAGIDVGIKNNDALAKIQQYLKVAINETGVQPVRGETTEKFLTRAAEMTLGKIK